MTEYFLGLIAFSFVGAAVFSLVPSGGAKRYVRLLFGLCAVGCIAFPLFEIANGLSGEINDLTALFEFNTDISDNSVEIYNNFLNEAGVKNAENSLKSELMKELSAKYDDIDVKISVGKNGEEFYIIGVTVFLYPSGYHLEPKRIKSFCENRLLAECSIVYK